MRIFNNTVRVISSVLTALCVPLFIGIASNENKIADEYYIYKEDKPYVSEDVIFDYDIESLESSTAQKSKDVTAKLFGVFPIKTVRFTTSEKKMVVPGGIPFGIKMVSNGVIVSEVTDVTTEKGLISPAKKAGIKSGDKILSINGMNVRDNRHITKIVSKSKGKTLNLKTQRPNGKTRNLKITPLLDIIDNQYKLGIWIRDSSAGIGTVTFFEPNKNIFGGLGHPICDVETGKKLDLYEGNIVTAQIDSVTVGKKGDPGQLNGHFLDSYKKGEILKNDETGVYGTLYGVKVMSAAIPVAFKQEVETGEATVLTTVKGNAPREYKIEIEKVSYNEEREIKNMIIHVTDKELLEKAGGIVQGMSGSPIIQNGRLVGAVTHVFVNDSTRGYGIFAENMISSAGEIDRYKKASAS